MPEIRLALPSTGVGGTVEIDGENIANAVRSLELRADAGGRTEVTLALVARPTVVAGVARLHLSAYTVAVLARFGWFAPEGATVNTDGSVLLADLPAGDSTPEVAA